MTKLQVAVVIPAYRAADRIVDVLKTVPKTVSNIIVIDDACPDESGLLAKKKVKDSRLEVVFHERNLGVGGATVSGMNRALELGANIVVKLDADGQMDPRRIPELLQPILNYEADYVKGNRFHSLESLEKMPRIRIFGNAILSLMSKFSTGYWDITDPTNGFFAIHSDVLRRIHLEKLRKGWFFESDLLFRASLVRAVVLDLPMDSVYGDQSSNLKPIRVIPEFVSRHTVNLFKRIFYNYYLKEWNIVSLELPIGVAFFGYATYLGLNNWLVNSQLGQPTPVGTLFLVAILGIFGLQLLLSAVAYDIQSVPKRVVHDR